jgi:hypothetical protein
LITGLNFVRTISRTLHAVTKDLGRKWQQQVPMIILGGKWHLRTTTTLDKKWHHHVVTIVLVKKWRPDAHGLRANLEKLLETKVMPETILHSKQSQGLTPSEGDDVDMMMIMKMMKRMRMSSTESHAFIVGFKRDLSSLWIKKYIN